MKTLERNPRFTNPLAQATSPYLKQHAHNPVFWYPWGAEALAVARKENKPILLSIGYSTCYWCHVMEREVFENLSIAALMNRFFVNIKVDREEHPEIDDIYMVARQLMTHEGGWPNNVFLTPDLKPFYAGGTFGPEETYGKPAFPRLLEWVHYSWTTQETEVRATADNITEAMKPHLIYLPPEGELQADAAGKSAQLFSQLSQYFDERAGGFFQAPKFPHECYLAFLLGYHEHTGDVRALEMVTKSLSRMAAGGLYDHVGCGFHRYAVDKDWLVPHFEKMLYNQAQLARLYTDAARITGNPYFADVAMSVLDFVSGPMTSGTGAFYSAIDAETDAVEGAYYVWSAEELQKILTPDEITFFTHFYNLAELPHFPGHKHPDGQVVSARAPLDVMAAEAGMPYVQLAAMAAQLMNKLLQVRNRREAPGLDDKIITGWNGLMMDAFAHAGRVLGKPNYVARARQAADFLLEHAIDNDGGLKRIVTSGPAQIDATLEDYAMLVRGLISLHRAAPDDSLLESTISLMQRAEELFHDAPDRGYFFMHRSDNLLMRLKSGDDGALPNANAVMLQNLTDLFAITKDTMWRDKAQAQADYFLGGNTRVLAEFATMLQAALTLEEAVHGKTPKTVQLFTPPAQPLSAPDDVVTVSTDITGSLLTVTLTIKEGWHINAARTLQRFLIPTQLDVQGEGVKVDHMDFPAATYIPGAKDDLVAVYEGASEIKTQLSWPAGAPRPPLKVRLRFQPCSGTLCHAPRDIAITI